MFTVRIVDVYVATVRGVQISLDVDCHAIATRFDVKQLLAQATFPGDLMALNAGREVMVLGIRVSFVSTGIGDVNATLVRLKHDSVGHRQSFEDDVNFVGLGIELVDPVPRNFMRFGQSPWWVREPQTTA